MQMHADISHKLLKQTNKRSVTATLKPNCRNQSQMIYGQMVPPLVQSTHAKRFDERVNGEWSECLLKCWVVGLLWVGNCWVTEIILGEWNVISNTTNLAQWQECEVRHERSLDLEPQTIVLVAYSKINSNRILSQLQRQISPEKAQLIMKEWEIGGKKINHKS